MGMDPKQAEYMKEMCILVNEKDEAVGEASKKDCHLAASIKKGGKTLFPYSTVIGDRTELI